MLRTALAVIVAVLLLAIAALGLGGWRMSQTIDNLGNALVTMNETQKSLLDSQQRQNQPAEIHGMCYLGQRSRPAENVDVAIYQLPEMKVVRRVITNAEGNFRSGFLPTGEYLLLVPLIGQANPLFPFSSDESNPKTDGPIYRVQTAPLTVYPGMSSPNIELDVQMIEIGQLSFELASAVPDLLVKSDQGANYHIQLLINATAEPGMATLPIDPLKSSTTHSWPLIGIFRYGLGPLYQNASRFADQPVPYNEWAPLPARKYKVSASFQADTSPLPNQPGFGGGYIPYLTTPPHSFTEVEVKPGERTHIRILPPEQLDETYRKLLNDYIDADGRSEVARKHETLAELRRARPAKLEIVGYYPLESEEKNKTDKQKIWFAPTGGYGGLPAGGAF